MLYFLWDLGLKVGHATRSIADCLTEGAKDTTIRTALLDARLITGDKRTVRGFLTPLPRRMQGRRRGRLHRREAGRACGPPSPLRRQSVRGRAERQGRPRRIARSADAVLDRPLRLRYPDHGRTGRARPALITARGQARPPRWEFLWTVRFHLHYVAGRAEERLTFDLQPVVGARMGYTRHGRQDGVERFMRHYFLTARESPALTASWNRRSCARHWARRHRRRNRPALSSAGFVLAEGKLLPLPRPRFRYRADPDAAHPAGGARPQPGTASAGIRSLIQNERRAISLRGDPKAADMFMDLLCGRNRRRAPAHADGARWLAVLNETGFLGRFYPTGPASSARCNSTPTMSSPSTSTRSRRSASSTRWNAASCRRSRRSPPLVDHMQSRRALYMAMLLHDIAKGRGGDHSEIGAEIALEVGPALGLIGGGDRNGVVARAAPSAAQPTAFKRDIDDPKTILDLADTIQSPERLRLLLVLTVADMRAVSSKVWNGWKATLLRELYARVAEVLAGGLSTTERDVRVKRAKQAAAALLSDWSEAGHRHFTRLGYPGYWLSFDPRRMRAMPAWCATRKHARRR